MAWRSSAISVGDLIRRRSVILVANILHGDFRRGLLEPIDGFFFVRIAAQFSLVRKNGVEGGVDAGEPLDGGAKFGHGLHLRKSRARLISGSLGDMRTTVPLFFARVFGRKEKDFARRRNRRLLGLVRSRRQNDQSGLLLIVAGQVIEIFFLGKNVGLRFLFPAGVAEQNDGAIDVGSELGAARGISGIGFAFAALLRCCGSESEG